MQMKISVRPGHITIALHVLIWSMVLIFPYLVSTADQHYRIGPIPGLFFSIATVIHMVIFYGNAFFLYPRLMNRHRWWLYVISAAALVLLTFPLKYRILATWFPEVLKDMTAYKFVFAPSVMIFVLSLVYRRVTDKIRHEREKKDKEAQQLATELKFLRSQISPHFLFNVLTNLVSLARKKSDKLEPSLIMLSELMRYMLYDSQGDKVLVIKEVTYLGSYIALQQLRFGTDVMVNVDIDVDAEGGGYAIEPMLLIPFVENAFKHGTGWVKQPQINISLSVKNGTLVFEVSNHYDKEQDTSKDENSGIGLINVKSRLDMLYRGRHTLEIRDTENIFHITLTLNLI
ncbi:MAG TPA: histidine kinase [Chitinophaga sp.]|uniref:sensor histidine kinase n=1 Tax=Chitinophaga sp. TaxID=1869181 RepID=UPI002CF4B0E3|nr:histidine kinase [Chitinophaga sp.]HVI47473.1 histidine kinase [Chitinophaga sp.]